MHSTYIQLHNCKSMIIHTFHPRSSLHFASLPIFHLLAPLDVSSPRFKNPPLLPNKYFPNPLSKKMRFTGESRLCLSRQLVPQFECPVYKGVCPSQALHTAGGDRTLSVHMYTDWIAGICEFVALLGTILVFKRGEVMRM